MSRTLPDTRRWVQHGTKLFAEALAGLDEQEYGAPSLLPSWTRKHLVAHVAANATAVGNLVDWAATGERTPMYSSPEQRGADIEAGATRSGSELTAWFTKTAQRLEDAMDALTAAQWATEVVTAQGRTVPATEVPWLRAREVLVHAVDLGTGTGFGDLPADFLVALLEDVVGKRSAATSIPSAGPALVVEATDVDDLWTVAGTGDPVRVTGSLATVTSYLTGRGHERVSAADHQPVPALPPWL